MHEDRHAMLVVALHPSQGLLHGLTASCGSIRLLVVSGIDRFIIWCTGILDLSNRAWSHVLGHGFGSTQVASDAERELLVVGQHP